MHQSTSTAILAVWTSINLLTAQTWTAQPTLVRSSPLAYDLARQRLVMFGGTRTILASGAPNRIGLGDLREFDGANWGLREPHGTQRPPARRDHLVAYDAGRRLTIVHGGIDNFGGELQDTWAWDGREFTLLGNNMTGIVAMTYDPVQRAVVALARSSGLVSLWRLNGRTWTFGNLVTGPDLFGNEQMVFDTARQNLVLFAPRSPTPQTWVGTGTTWTRIAGAAPTDRATTALAYDPLRQRVVLFGGGGYGSPPRRTDTWEFDGVTWTQRTPSNSPSAAVAHAMTYDADRGVIVLAAESQTTNTSAFETWAWNGNDWRRTDQVLQPAPRVAPAIGYHRATERMVLCGGQSWATSSLYFTDTWLHDGFRWTQARGSSPSARNGERMAEDTRRGRLVLFGGRAPDNTLLQDTWEWDGSSWSLVNLSAPAPRSGHAMCYSPALGLTILFGGSVGTGTLADTWQYDGATWQQLNPANAPSARQGAAMAYDPASRRLVMFGGADDQQSLDDTWTFDGANWTSVTTAQRPPARTGAGLTSDPLRSRLVLHAGAFAWLSGNLWWSTPLSDTWTYDGLDWRRAQPAGTPSTRLGSAIVYDEAHRQHVVHSWDVVTPVVRESLVFGALAQQTEFGHSCGRQARLSVFDGVALGNPACSVDLEGAVANAPAAFLLSTRPAAVSLPDSCVLWVDPTTAVGVPAATNAAGIARLPLPLPNHPILAGVTFAVQGVTIDSVTSLGFSLTAGLLLTLGD